MSRKKFEYQWFHVSPGVDPLIELNALGAEGWQVKAVIPGSLYDTVSHARVLLEREVEE